MKTYQNYAIVLLLMCCLVSDEHSRVKLVPIDDDEEGSDYINASYVPVCLHGAPISIYVCSNREQSITSGYVTHSKII